MIRFSPAANTFELPPNMEKKGAITMILERFVFSENIEQLNMFCHLKLLLPTISLF